MLLVEVISLVALGIVADAAGWPSFRVALGPLLVCEFERGPAGTAWTLGGGVAVVAGAGGFVNAGVAALLHRRHRVHSERA